MLRFNILGTLEILQNGRVCVPTAPKVRVLVYSEAPSTDFRISSLEIAPLRPVDTQ